MAFTTSEISFLEHKKFRNIFKINVLKKKNLSMNILCDKRKKILEVITI